MPLLARLGLLFITTLISACHTGLDVPKGTPDGGASCSSIMSQAACAARADCIADTCNECSCTPVFVGCRTQAQPQTACPALGCAQPGCCHNDSDCAVDGASQCMVPPIMLGCGICDTNPGPSTCATDADCTTPGQICDPVPCACPSAGAPPMACTQGCTTDADCPEPESCGTDSRCHAKPCDATCTGNYDCSSNPAVGCTRKACSTDSDCGQPGYCIDQLCSHSVGQCESLPA